MWVKSLFAGLKFPDDVLKITLDCTQQVLMEVLPPEAGMQAVKMVEAGIQKMNAAPISSQTFIPGDSALDKLAQGYLESLLHTDRKTASHMIMEAVNRGVSLKEIYLGVFERTQREIGRLWQTNQISVAQEHFCTATTQMVMSQLYPYLFNTQRKNRRMVTACVGGELHEIGARMVADFFEMEGWDTIFLGANTPPEGIIKTIEDHRADLLALSTTMTFHISLIRETIAQIHERVSTPTRILVGGYPFNLIPDLWRKVGADGYAPDAESALEEANRVLMI